MIAADRSSERKECLLVVGWFAVLLQILIAGLAASSLLYKRHYLEKEPRRPHKVWLMDMGKQCTQGFFVHFTNMSLAILMARAISDASSNSPKAANLAHHLHHKDECALYFISFVLDTFVGVFIIWGLLHGVSQVARR